MNKVVVLDSFYRWPEKHCLVVRMGCHEKHMMVLLPFDLFVVKINHQKGHEVETQEDVLKTAIGCL